MRSERGLTATLFSWNDLLLSLFAACIFLFAILITKINEDKATQEDAASAESGMVSVYCFWQDGIDADVDMHVIGPDNRHIYYNFMQGRIWSLLRDDQGHKDDPGKRNFENMATRGLENGEYIINVHLFRVAADVKLPVEVECEARITSGEDVKHTNTLVFREITALQGKGHEDTMFRFVLYDNGKVVPGSMNREFKAIAKE